MESKFGFELTILGVDESGRVPLDKLKANLKPNTVFVSVAHANNEIGTIQDLEGMGKLFEGMLKKTEMIKEENEPSSEAKYCFCFSCTCKQ